MSDETHRSNDDLERRLESLSAAMRLPQGPRATEVTRPAERSSSLRIASGGGIALALALVAVSIATGQALLLIPALMLAALSSALLIRGVSDALLGPKDANHARIGLGASIGAGAVIEPAATVEMGAEVGEGATVKRGAIVRSGASVHAQAVVEEDAVVSWGADVQKDARVGRGATVGAGATVHEGAEVPAGMRLFPGTDWARGAKAAQRPAQSDPREARIHAICDRIEAELRQAPQNVRVFLGASDDTVRALRETCLGLIARERTLRAESSDESLAFLEKEKRELEARAAASPDERIRQSLRSAVSAIDEQLRHRSALRANADRLAADVTRLEWTLDGMGAQLVRLRTAGAQAGPDATGEVVRTVHQLNDEIDALTHAMEEVSSQVAPVDVGSPDQHAGPRVTRRDRER